MPQRAVQRKQQQKQNTNYIQMEHLISDSSLLLPAYYLPVTCQRPVSQSRPSRFKLSEIRCSICSGLVYKEDRCEEMGFESTQIASWI